MTTDEALRVAREALENILGVEVMAPEGGREEVTEIHGIARSALRTIALAVEGPKPEPCPLGKGQNDPDCTNRHQCWEPCGELGKSEDHVRVGQEPAAKFSPAVQSVALGEPKAIQHPSTRPRSVDDPAGLPGASNDQQEKQ